MISNIYASAPRLTSAPFLQTTVPLQPDQSSKNIKKTNKRLQSGTTAISFSTLVTSYGNYTSESRLLSAQPELIPAVQKIQSANPRIINKQHQKRIQSAVGHKIYQQQEDQALRFYQEPSNLIRIIHEADIIEDVREDVKEEVKGEFPIQRINLQSQLNTSKIVSMIHSISSQQSQQRMIVTESNMESAEVLRRMKFDPDIKTQVLRLKISKISDRNLKNILAHITMRQKVLLDAAKNQYLTKLYDILQELTEYSFSTQSVVILLEILCLSGLICENVLEFNHAIYFYNQIRQLCNHSRRLYDEYKIKSFLGLAMCCFHFKRYEDVLKLLKKCLQYAWAAKNVEAEIEIYDRLSICYFYTGNLEKSHFYHERAITYDYELDDSSLKQLAVEILRIFLEKNYIHFLAKNINISLLGKVELPINNELLHQEVPEYDFPNLTMSLGGLRSFPQSRTTSRHHSKLQFRRQETQTPALRLQKSYVDLEINGLEMLNQILNDTEFEFQVYTPKHSYRSQAKSFDNQKPPNKSSVNGFHDPKLKTSRFSTKNLGVINEKNFPNPFEDSTKYNLPLPKKIDIRLKKTFSYTSTIQNIHELVGQKNNFQSDKMEKILINHKSTQREKESKVTNQKKRMQNINNAYSEMIYKMLSMANQK